MSSSITFTNDCAKPRASEKKYAVAVSLSAVFGILGVHHFYLGRWLHGVVDMSLTAGGVTLIVMDHLALGYLVLAIDYLHTIIITILLLIGSYKDGSGRPVCYPGQKLTS